MTIEPGLAIALAGQTALGLTPGDNHAERAQGCLQAIGLMLLQAVKDDEPTWTLVTDTLNLSTQSRVRVHPDGGVQISSTKPSAPPDDPSNVS